MMDWIVAGTVFLAGVFAVLVGVLSAMKLRELWCRGECSERMWLIWGIGLAAGGYGLNRAWVATWRTLGGAGFDVDWMATHWALTLFNALSCAGYLLHLRTLTWEWPWPDWSRLPWRLVEDAAYWVSARLRGPVDRSGGGG